DLLRSRLRRPGIKLTLHSPDKSYLEAVLARGGEDMGEVIERAWRAGARFDSWTEQFRADAWAQALAATGLDAQPGINPAGQATTAAERLATTALRGDASLPWDVISGTPDRAFLWAEWERAERGETTPDCRWGGCSACGACDDPPANDLASDGEARQTRPQRSGRVEGAGRETPVADPQYRRRYVATFSVTGRGRFIGHLDRVELFRRAIRRAGGRLALSAGMRPKALLSLALPLAVGVEGFGELCEFELAEDPGAEFFSRLAAALPRHIDLLALEPYGDPRSLPSRVTGARYEVGVRVAPPEAEAGAVLGEAGGRFTAATELPVEEVREGKVRRVDVRKYVEAISVREGPGGACTLDFRAAVTPSGTARPERVVEALGRLAGLDLEIEWIRRMQVELA
ncbi:MAG: DUF2344 domain-containing protein, partial [Thermoleophilia bacterium]|nr:DUF2344 domain-containing protein [Thermoleophilia bacterium]